MGRGIDVLHCDFLRRAVRLANVDLEMARARFSQAKFELEDSLHRRKNAIQALSDYGREKKK